MCDNFMCTFFSVYWSEILCLDVPPILASMRDTCMNPDVEITVFKTVFHGMFITLGIKFITKTKTFLQGSNTNLESNT